jgi:hypothetical protein
MKNNNREKGANNTDDKVNKLVTFFAFHAQMSDL